MNVEVFSDTLQEGDNIVVTPTADLTEGMTATDPALTQQTTTEQTPEKTEVENVE